MSRVVSPTLQTMPNHRSVPESTGHSRARRNTPAFTMVAECRNADTGVGAAIACGSQKWNGNCALLVKAPRSTRITIAGYQGWPRMRGPAARISSSP
jgi:hypothetical protein